jgi:hypothetical protein
MFMRSLRSLAAGVLLAACDPTPTPAPRDAAADGALDTAPDRGADVVPDAAPDVRPDAAPDVSPDAAMDAAMDARVDAGPPVEIQVLHFSDWHGQIDPLSASRAGPDGGMEQAPLHPVRLVHRSPVPFHRLPGKGILRHVGVDEQPAGDAHGEGLEAFPKGRWRPVDIEVVRVDAGHGGVRGMEVQEAAVVFVRFDHGPRRSGPQVEVRAGGGGDPAEEGGAAARRTVEQVGEPGCGRRFPVRTCDGQGRPVGARDRAYKGRPRRGGGCCCSPSGSWRRFRLRW